MSRSPDVVVIGGGIVGLCAAVAAADRGLQVTVVDDARPGAASRSSAGMLGPSLPGLPVSLRDLAIAARDMYPRTVEELTQRSGVKIQLDRGGILEIAESEARLEDMEQRGAGVADRLGRSALATLEPALREHAGAMLHPLDGWVDNRAMMDALWIAAEHHPHVQVVRDRVATVDIASAGTAAALVGGGLIGCEKMVLASGAWFNITGLPRRVPVRPVKGELLTLSRCPLRHVVYGAGGYLVPRGDALLVGATSEESTVDPSATPVGRAYLRGKAAALVPELSKARVVEHWGGLRPFSPDGLPMLGKDADFPALVYACGFSRNGILLAPWAGASLAALLSDCDGAGIPVEFSPARFGENTNRL